MAEAIPSSENNNVIEEFRAQLRKDIIEECNGDLKLLREFADDRAFRLDSFTSFRNSLEAAPKRIIEFAKDAYETTKSVGRTISLGVSGLIGGGVAGFVIGGIVAAVVLGIILGVGGAGLIGTTFSAGKAFGIFLAIGGGLGLLVGAAVGAHMMMETFKKPLSEQEQQKVVEKEINKLRSKEMGKIREEAYGAAKKEGKKEYTSEKRQEIKNKLYLYDQLIKLTFELEGDKNGEQGVQKLSGIYNKDKADWIERAKNSNHEVEGNKITNILPTKESLLSLPTKKPRPHSTGNINPEITHETQKIMEKAVKNIDNSSQQTTDNNSPPKGTKKNDERRHSI